ncbi:hypothetical protein EDB35_102149 [Vibrio crassostreae]|nr:hypothetical protein EDB35_102149 [Vibrio crassostreae]TCT85155.1 hypothetical protein EDB43_104238 [Vibrio crassostreae]TCU11492.1 hypothetical protein EDB32_102234 [Vibrio crassostreae]
MGKLESVIRSNQKQTLVMYSELILKRLRLKL